MTYDAVPELHYILPIENVASVVAEGILSHRRAAARTSVSVADAVVQQRRAAKRVRQGNALHTYVNLYFHARNPMLYRLKEAHARLCVLSVRKEVLHEPGVVIADRNAASDYARFGEGLEGLTWLDAAQVYARDWDVADERQKHLLRSIKCAEVLVPDCVVPRFVRGAYVSCASAAEQVQRAAPGWRVKVSPDLFFQPDSAW